MSLPYNRTIIQSGQLSVSRLNSELKKIQDALARGVDRFGNVPNEMNSDLDLNQNDLLNVRVLYAEHIELDGNAIPSLQQMIDLFNRAKQAAEDSEQSAEDASESADRAEDAADEAARIVGDAIRVKIVPDTSYTVQPTDTGYILWFTNDNPVTVVVPAMEDPKLVQLLMAQAGAGPVTTVPGPGAIVDAEGDARTTAARYAPVSLARVFANTWWLVGQRSGSPPLPPEFSCIPTMDTPPAEGFDGYLPYQQADQIFYGTADGTTEDVTYYGVMSQDSFSAPAGVVHKVVGFRPVTEISGSGGSLLAGIYAAGTTDHVSVQHTGAGVYRLVQSLGGSPAYAPIPVTGWDVFWLSVDSFGRVRAWVDSTEIGLPIPNSTAMSSGFLLYGTHTVPTGGAGFFAQEFLTTANDISTFSGVTGVVTICS